ncbi:class I SAM-dependent methyltransferase [Candidatus Margulisiibacteriota bacterium]
MAALKAKANAFINRTAQAAYYHPITKYGFSVSGRQPLKGKQKAAYFLLGLGQSLVDKVNSLSAARPTLPQYLPMTAPLHAPVLHTVKSKGLDRLLLPTMAQMSATGRGGGGGPELVNKVEGFFVGKEALSLQEIGIGINEGISAVKKALDQLVAADRLETRDGTIYYQRWLTGQQLDAVLSKVKQAENDRFHKFLATVDIIHRDLGEERLATPSVGDIVRVLTQYTPHLCGREAVELLTKNPNGSLYLASGILETGFRPAGHPSGYYKTILEGKEDFYDVTINKGRVEARDKEDGASQLLAQELVKAKDRVRHYSQAGVERMIFLRLRSDQGAEGVLVFYNPVFFETEDYGSVKRQFKAIANVAGRALGRRIQPQMSPTVVEPDAAIAMVLDLQQRGIEKYSATGEQKVWDSGAKYYDRRIAGQVDRNSREDVMAYLGQRIQEALDKASPEESIKILDLACGTGNMLPYIMARFSEQAHRLSIAMVDWSGVAIARARARAEKLATELDIKSLDIQFEVADMLDLVNRYPENTFDIAFAHMGFYAPEQRVAQAINGFTKVLKPGGYGTLDIMKQGGSFAIVKKETVSYEWRTKGLWGVLTLFWQKIWSRAFGYANFLESGFKTRSYFAPDKARWLEFLGEQGLEATESRETLANQFLLAQIKKPE